MTIEEKTMKDKIKLLEKENENLSKGYDDWHNLYSELKRNSDKMKGELLNYFDDQIKRYQEFNNEPNVSIILAKQFLEDLIK